MDDRAAAAPLPNPALGFLRKMAAIADLEVRKLRHDPTELASRAVQPLLWLVIFGPVMSHGHVIDTGTLPYLDYIVPGILAQSVLFIAIFNGISVIWERDLGIVHKFLVSPTPRTPAEIALPSTSAVRGAGLTSSLCTMPRSRSQMTAMP